MLSGSVCFIENGVFFFLNTEEKTKADSAKSYLIYVCTRIQIKDASSVSRNYSIWDHLPKRSFMYCHNKKYGKKVCYF